MEYYNVFDNAYMQLVRNPHKNICKVLQLSHYDETIADITDSVQSDSISINIRYNQGTQRTCSLKSKLYDINSRDSPFFVNSKFRVYFGVQGATDTYWFSQGIFIPTSISHNGEEMSVSAVDKFGFFTKELNQQNITIATTIPAKTNAVDLIKDVLTIDMGNGMLTDAIEPNIDSSFFNFKTPRDIAKSQNSTYGEILTDIATALCSDIYYDGNGRLCVSKSYTDDYKSYAPVWTTENVDSFTINADEGNVYNSVTCCGTDSEGRMFSYTAENNNAQSNINISVIGRKSADVEESTMCINEDNCRDYAEYKLKQYTIVSQSASFEYQMLPHVNTNEIFRIGKIDYVTQEVTKTLQKIAVSACNVKFLPFSDWG